MGPVTTQEIEAGVTTPERTVLECARTLPFDAGPAVVDSALRSGLSRGSLLAGTEPFGFERRAGWSCQASVWAQPSRSAARAVISGRTWFWARPWKQLPQAGVLEVAGAFLGAGPLPVAELQRRQGPARGPELVAKQVIRQPRGQSVAAAPGWGRSRRAMTRIPASQPGSVAGR